MFVERKFKMLNMLKGYSPWNFSTSLWKCLQCWPMSICTPLKHSGGLSLLWLFFSWFRNRSGNNRNMKFADRFPSELGWVEAAILSTIVRKVIGSVCTEPWFSKNCCRIPASFSSYKKHWRGTPLKSNEWIETLQNVWKSKLLILLVTESWRLLRRVQL